MNILLGVPGATRKFERFSEWCHERLFVRRKSMALEQTAHENKEPSDLIGWLIKAQEDGDRTAPPTEAAIREDARMLVLAGRSVSSSLLL